jgi:hypothetical protein
MKEYKGLQAFSLSFSLSTALTSGQVISPQPVVVPLLDDEVSL